MKRYGGKIIRRVPQFLPRSKATKQSILSFCGAMDCFAALANDGKGIIPESGLQIACLSATMRPIEKMIVREVLRHADLERFALRGGDDARLVRRAC
jgi:hypothetical protein